MTSWTPSRRAFAIAGLASVSLAGCTGDDDGDDAGSTDIQISIVSTNAPISAGETLEVDVTVENLSGNDVERTVRLEVAGEDRDSESVDVAADGSTEITLSWTTTSADAGEHEVRAVSDDAVDSVQVDILGPTYFDVAIDDVPSSTPAGHDVDVQVTVTNTGSQGEQNVRLLVAEDEVDAETVAIDGGDTQTITLTWATEESDEGSYAIEVSSDDTSVQENIFIVEPAGFFISIEETNSPRLAGDDLVVDTAIENVGDVAGEQDVSLSINGEQVLEEHVSLESGDSTSLTFTWTTIDEVVGYHTATVASNTHDASVDIEILQATPATSDAVEATMVMQDLDVPWDLTFAGEDAFYTERDGGVYRIDAALLTEEANLTPNDAELLLSTHDLPDYHNPSHGGVMGITAHPDYPDPQAIFIYYSYDDGDPWNRVIRYDLDTESFTPIIDEIPGTGHHHGGRITIGPQGHLWATTGDAVNPPLVQDPSTLAGATLRVNLDGSAPEDNPTWDGDGDPRVYSIGHRNPQGIDFTPTGEILFSNHGPEARDEIGINYPEANYGWDIAQGGPDDPDYDSYTDHEDFTAPLINTGPGETWAPAGLAFYDDGAISNWTNRLLAGGLYSQTLWAITLAHDEEHAATVAGDDATIYDQEWLDDSYVAVAEPLFNDEFGRLRHPQQGPDGSIYLLTSNMDWWPQDPYPIDEDDRIIRLDPV